MRDGREFQKALRRGFAGVQIFNTVTQWADERRHVAANASARPGPWRTDDVPYLRGIMDACSFSDPCERVVIQKGNQLGVTEGAVMNTIGYCIDSWPGPILVVIPREDDVREYVKTRFRPAMAATPSIVAKLGEAESDKGKAERETFMTFPGGQIYFMGSKAPVREKPISVAIVDDADACQRNAEGDIVELAAKRTVTYQRRKLIVISTPTIAGSSLVSREYEASSKRRFHIPCPACGAFGPLEWEHLVWTAEAIEDVRYRCPHCAAEWRESEKLAAMQLGYWEPGEISQVGKREGFHVSALYSPFRRWADIVRDFRAAHRALTDENDTSKMQVFMNCDIGKPFVLPEQVKLQGIELEVYKRREPPFDARTLPIHVVTVGADVQANRLEASAYGWATGMESWLLEHVVIKGAIEEYGVWDELAQLATGVGARGLCVDAGAYAQTVKDQVMRLLVPLIRARCAIWAIRGLTGKAAIWPRATRPGETVNIGIDTAKDQIFGSLERITTPGPGYIHIPTSCNEAWLNQLFSERPATAKDRTRARYVKMEGRRRNEALDCAVYGRAGAYALMALDPHLAALLLPSATGAPPPRSGRGPAPKRPLSRRKKLPPWIKP